MELSEIDYPRVLVLALSVVIVALFVSVGFTSGASLGAYNPAWDGTSEIRASAETMGSSPVVARNTTAYSQTTPSNTIAIVLSPDSRYRESETAHIESFVSRGGTVIIAEDYGRYGNQLLATIGATARINGSPLRDEQRAGPSPAFPRAEVTADHPLTEDVEELMLNHGSAVEPHNATTLIRSSQFSYLDTNRNQELDRAESLDARAVVTVESVGSGQVVVISDPSVFLNSMLERSDNAAFLKALVGTHEQVLLDVSHSESLPPLVEMRLTLQQSSVLLFGVGTLSVLTLVILSAPVKVRERMRSWRTAPNHTPTMGREELAALIAKRHPEWDEKRVNRVSDSLIRCRQIGDRDD